MPKSKTEKHDYHNGDYQWLPFVVTFAIFRHICPFTLFCEITTNDSANDPLALPTHYQPVWLLLEEPCSHPRSHYIKGY